GARYSTNDVAIAALSIYFNRPFTMPVFDESKTITLTTAELDKYLGKYSSTQIPLKLDITKKNATLFAGVTSQSAVPLEAKGGDKFVYAMAGATLQFEPAKKTFNFTQGGKTYLFTKTD